MQVLIVKELIELSLLLYKISFTAKDSWTA